MTVKSVGKSPLNLVKTLGLSGAVAFIFAACSFPGWTTICSGHAGSAIAFSGITLIWMTALLASAVRTWQGENISFLGPMGFIISFCTILSAFWMLVFYPAAMSADSFAHWQQALHNRYSTWHPPILAMFMHVTQYFVKSPSLFGFIQGVFFWGALFYLIRHVSAGRKAFLIISILMAVLPPLWLYSNATISNTSMASWIMLSMAFLIQSVKRGQMLFFILSTLFLSIGIMFRREAVVCLIVPIIIYLLSFRPKDRLVKKAAAVFIILASGILPAKIVELSPCVVPTTTSQVHGIFNQYVGTIYHSMSFMTESEINAERESINLEFGNGVFQKLIQGYDCRLGDYIIYNRHVPRVLKRIPREKNGFIIKKVAQAAIRHPTGYLKHQICYFSHLTQLSEISYQSWGVLEKQPKFDAVRARLGIEYKSKLPAVKERYVRLMNLLIKNSVCSIIFRHYIFLMLSAVVLGYGLYARKIELIIPAFFSVVYPLIFLAVGTAGLWRYLLISYCGSWVCLLAILNQLVGRIKKRACQRVRIQNQNDRDDLKKSNDQEE